MKIRHIGTVIVMFATAMIWSACGGGGSSSSSDPTGGGGTASVESLASLPSVDLSNYDSSTSASANLSALLSKGSSKSFGEGMQEVGGNSRAGCEANMHKMEIFRMSQQVQLDRCYPEAMESAGIITIPTGSYAYYRFEKGEDSAEDRAKMCDGIPDDRVEEKETCLQGGEGPGGGGMKLRIGRFDNELRIDMCEGAAGSEVLTNEATYGADGSVYTAGIVRIGTWNGNTEKGKFDVTVDLGETGTVTNGVVALGDDGLLNAAGQMSGGFGSGNIDFERIGADSSNIIAGAFKGGYTDPYTGTTTSFTGKTYSHFGGETATGCAKYSFTGSMPGILVANIIPYDIPADQQANFLLSFGAELGIANLGMDDVLCPNPAFDPENPDPLVKPMLAANGTTCPEVINTGVECFAISNVEETGDFGEIEYTQLFTIIDNTQSLYYDEVNAYDISGLTTDIDTIAFTRNWDCTGEFTLLDPGSFDETTMQKMQTGMQACKAIEEKARANEGMGGYSCGEDEQMNAVDNFKDEGGGAQSFGPFGGKLELNNINDCPEVIEPAIANVFVNVVDIEGKIYCIPMEGGCEQFTLSAAEGGFAAATNIPWGDMVITTIGYNGAAPTLAAIVWSDGEDNDCTAFYDINQPEFTSEGGEGTEGMPEACIEAELTTPETCQQFCMQSDDPCGFRD